MSDKNIGSAPPQASKNMAVKAKFQCNSVLPNEYGTSVNFHAVYSEEGENKDYAEATPHGIIQMLISKGKPAAEFFKQGKDYLLTFEEVPNFKNELH